MKKILTENNSFLSPRRLAHGIDLSEPISLNFGDHEPFTTKQKFLLKNYFGATYLLRDLKDHITMHQKLSHKYPVRDLPPIKIEEIKWALEKLVDFENLEFDGTKIVFK